MFRSNPGTPTQPRRPDFIGVNSPANQANALYYDFPIQQQQQAAAVAAQLQQQQQQQRMLQNPSIHHGNGGRSQQNTVYGSPQRRFLSEGELVRQGAELSYARTNNTTDNIRELAGSPEHGVYSWKDSSPGYNNQPQFAGMQGQQPSNMQRTMGRGPPQQMPPGNMHQMSQDYNSSRHRSNPTSPTQQYGNNGGAGVGNVSQRYPPMQNSSGGGGGGGYHPAMRGGVPVFPPQPSPQIKRKATPTRPISFVRALEMADTMEMQAMSNNGAGADLQKQNKNNGLGPAGNNSQHNNTQKTSPNADRASVYDINYEISV